ncbi:MAG: hypothetical protein CL675_14170 [Bdellovibrionaceae bacterium]|nr:hypothetical protein [Pseudobdellovibrionaceae bacterium]
MGKATLALAVAAFGIAVSAQAEITYVPDDKVQELQKQFKEAKAPDAVRLDFEKNHRWTCKLYGVRSQMQVEKGIGLYHFDVEANPQSKTSKVVINRGAQIMQRYEALQEGLVAQKGPLKDIVRLTPNGKLIAELSITNREPASQSKKETKSVLDRQRNVVAYALCD